MNMMFSARLWLLVLFSAMELNFADSAPGTTLNIKQIFIGRCLEYEELSREKFIEPTNINCTYLWSTFMRAWAFKDPRTVMRPDYDAFFESAKQTNIPPNKVLLWSGTYAIAHEYSNDGTRYVTLEDSLIGYLVNGLTWCGIVCVTCDGINYEKCPDFSDLPKAASQAFWGGASSTFARSASGEVRLMLSGTNEERPAYSRDSFFAQFELTALPETSTLHVILVNALGQPPLEHCNNGSLVLLQEDTANKGIQYNCVENPLDILHLMCVGNPTVSRCLMENLDIRKQRTLEKPLTKHKTGK